MSDLMNWYNRKINDFDRGEGLGRGGPRRDGTGPNPNCHPEHPEKPEDDGRDYEVDIQIEFEKKFENPEKLKEYYRQVYKINSLIANLEKVQYNLKKYSHMNLSDPFSAEQENLLKTIKEQIRNLSNLAEGI